MLTKDQQTARDRVFELAAEPEYRPYIVGYLLSCLDERHWTALVQSALEFTEGVKSAREAAEARAGELRRHGG